MMWKRFSKHLAGAGVLAGTLLTAPAALAAWELNMPKGVTSITRDIFSLH